MIDDLNLDGLVEPVSAPPLNVSGLVQPSKPTTSHLPDLMGFLWSRNLTPGSTTGGRHNLGSLHYSGNAIDIKGSGAFSDAQVAALKQDAASRGFLIRDERVRPPNQKVWGGPHVHIEYAGGPQTSTTQQSDDGINLDGLVEPLNVQGLTETFSIVPPVPQAPQPSLSLNDAAWHLSLTPDEWDALSPKQKQRAAMVLDEAVAEDQRKRSLGQEIQQPSVQYQNEMRKQARLPLKSLAEKYYNGADEQGRPLGSNPLMPIDRSAPTGQPSDAALMDQATKNVAALNFSPTANLTSLYRMATQGKEAGFEADVQEEFQRLKAQQERANTPEMIAARKRIGSVPESLPGMPSPRGVASAVQRFGGEALKAAAGAADAGSVVSGLGPLASYFGVNPIPKVKDYLNQRGTVLEESASLPMNEQGQAIERSLPEKATDAVTGLGLSLAQLVLLKKATGLSLGPLMALESALKNSDAKAADRIGGAAEAYAMGKILDQHLSRPLSALAFGAPTAVQSGLSVAQGNMKLEDALLQTGVQVVAGAVLGGKQIIPNVPRETSRIDTMPDIPDVPVGTISEPRVIKGEQKNATENRIVAENGEQQYQGASQRAAIPGNGSEARSVESQQASSRDRTEGSRQVQQEALNVKGLVEPSEQPNTVVPASMVKSLPEGESNVNRPAETMGGTGKQISATRETGRVRQATQAVGTADESRGATQRPTKIREPSQRDVDNAVSGTYEGATTSKQETVNVDSLTGGVRLSDPAERRRVDALKVQMQSPNAHFTRVVVDAEGNVVEGQHRLEAARELGIKDVPILRVSPVSDAIPNASDVAKELQSRIPMRPEHARQLVDRAAEIVSAEGFGALKDYDAPQGYEKEWNALTGILKRRPVAPQTPVEVAKADNEPSKVVNAVAESSQSEPQPIEAKVEPQKAKPSEGIVPDVPQPDRLTGIKNAVVEAEREIQGLPQFQKARRAHGASFDEGVLDVQTGRIKPRELASDIVRAFYDPKFSMERFQSRRPRPLSTEESMALLYDRMKIATEQKAAEAEFDAANQSGDETRIATAVDEVSRLQQASNANDEADYVSGGEQSRGLAIRIEMIKDDFSRARVLSQAVARNKGKPLPAEVQAKLESTVEELAKAHARITDLEAQQSKTIAESDIGKTIRQHQREIRSQGRQRIRQVIATERADIKQQIAAEFVRLKASQSSTLSQGGLGNLDPEGRITKLVGQLARGYVEEGVTKAADLVEAVHGYIKDVADLTKREVQDLISGYGKTSQPKPDEIGKKLAEIRTLLRVVSGKADVVERGIRPLRSGFQRPKPSQELREATRDLRNTLREHGIEVEKSARSPTEQQKSILDAAKTTTRNRIEDLTKWIADGKRTVTGKSEIIPDAELRSLRTERDRLQTVFDAIKDPEADQKSITRALGATNKSILELESKIKGGEIAPKTKIAQPTSPELEAARATQKTLQDILRDMWTAEKRASKPAEDPDITDARRVLAAQKAFMTRNRQRMVAMQGELALAQRGVKTEKAKREPLPLTDEMKVAQRNANQQRRNIDNIYAVIDWQNKTSLQKGLAYGAAGVRAGVLSGLKVLGKIGGALLQRIPQQYIEEGAGKGWAKIYPDVAAKAPRHGAGINAATEAEFLRGLKSGALEIPSIIKTGDSELSLAQGKRYPNIPTKIGTALAIPGRVHMAEKNILKVGEYNRSLEANLQWAERQGMDRSNPDVIEQAKQRAYKDAEEIVLLGDNLFSRFLRNGRRSMSDEGKSLTRIVVPVERVPSNYLAQAIGDYGFGLIRGTIRALKARNPELLEKMSPEDADKTMRLLKRGSLGLVYTALASSGVVGFGGYWSQRKKGDKRDIAPNDVKIGPVTISHTWVHSPPVELAQFAATIKREIQNRDRKHSVINKTLTGVAHGVKGLADQTPFLNQYTHIYDSFRSGDALEKKLGEMLAGWIEPQIVKELAGATDREEKGRHTIIPWKGEAVQRKAKSFSDSLLVGLPIGREYVQKDRKKMMEIRQQERRGSITPPVPGALNLNGLVEPSPTPPQ